MTNIQQQLARTWDEAYSQGFRCGQDYGYCLGWDAATKEVLER